jgi:hypothetical protein
MALEGPLKELQLHDVFQLLELGRKSGVLRVRSELRQAAAVVCFERGAVVAAGMGDDPPLLGVTLLRAGRITEADLARARALQTGGDPRRLGDLLVALGAISRREVDRQLKLQVEETICELLGWHEGYFRFEEGAPPAAVEAPVCLPTEPLLMEAARRRDEWSRIEGKVPHLGVVPKLPPPERQTNGRLDLIPFEWELLAAVDGERDLHELAAAVGRSEFEVARTVYELAGAGVLVVDEPLPTAYAASGPDPLVAEASRLVSTCDEALAQARTMVEAWSKLEPVNPSALGAVVRRLRAATALLTREPERGDD